MPRKSKASLPPITRNGKVVAEPVVGSSKKKSNTAKKSVAVHFHNSQHKSNKPKHLEGDAKKAMNVRVKKYHLEGCENLHSSTVRSLAGWLNIPTKDRTRAAVCAEIEKKLPANREITPHVHKLKGESKSLKSELERCAQSKAAIVKQLSEMKAKIVNATHPDNSSKLEPAHVEGFKTEFNDIKTKLAQTEEKLKAAQAQLAEKDLQLNQLSQVVREEDTEIVKLMRDDEQGKALIQKYQQMISQTQAAKKSLQQAVATDQKQENIQTQSIRVLSEE
jgi:DNA repair ATPase RecN